MRLNHLFLSGLLATSCLHAAENHDHDHHAGLSAHVHGEAELLVAVEANQLQLQLSSPAANLVGFEHKPRNEQQKQALASLQKTLADSSNLFVLPVAANCQLSEYQIGSSLLEEHGDHEDHAHQHKDEHDDHHKHHDDHDEHKHHDEHEEHAHHGEGEHADESGHADFNVNWRFNCTNPDKLSTLDVTLFNSFPALEKLSTQWISESGQGGATLTPAQQRLSMR